MARCGLDSHRALEVCVFGIGEGELAIIVVFGFLLFGPDKLPQMAARSAVPSVSSARRRKR